MWLTTDAVSVLSAYDSGYGTNLEGPISVVNQAITQCHEAVHAMGVERIATDIRLGTRTDKAQNQDWAQGLSENQRKRENKIGLISRYTLIDDPFDFMIAQKVSGLRSLRTSGVLRLTRAYSSDLKPCTEFLKPTHADLHDVAPDTNVAQELDRFKQTTLGTYNRPSLIFSHGKGLDLYAELPTSSKQPKEYRQYLDFSAGIAVNSLGHSDPQIARIAGEQAERLVHSSNLYYNEWSGRMANKLVEMTYEHGGLGVRKGAPMAPEASQLKAFIANSGTEANEAALKFARKASLVYANAPDRKTGLVCFKNAFHGRTMGSLSVTPNPKYQEPFEPLLGNVRVGELNNTRDLEHLITQDTAGVIVEPIQGEGGVIPAKLEFLQALRERCNQVGALLIYDEIQCGLFRTGTMWCHSELPLDAHPDMVTMAKPLANGFPIGAVLMRSEVAHAIVAGDHGTTFGGGPLVCRIAHHVLGRLSEEALLKNVAARSQQLMDRLGLITEMFDDLVQPSGPRGKGLIVGLPMKKAHFASDLVAMARQRGVLILSAGSDTLRFVPSLTVSQAEVDKTMDVLESCLVVLREQNDK
ncbi:acetylornithine transaminase [Malassezia psittaci]|uniref:Acetylornithine transaminase n=1 Tax=Malassezia psittaci TaxID=1821823 RepID=A0AAF0JEJ9_9BASI|nr:acetylornithine transaminase [Malassezia psittaci]